MLAMMGAEVIIADIQNKDAERRAKADALRNAASQPKRGRPRRR